MENKLHNIVGLLLVLLLGFSSCTATREQEIEDDISSFRAWVNEQSATIADRTEEDWKRAKADFRVRTNELDQRQEQFSDELKEEYQQLKEEFQSLDEKRESMRREAQMANWETKLLNTYADTSAITQENVKEVYTKFLENVRTLHSNWTDDDWEMAKMVMERLNERKEQIDKDLPTEDEVKIKALQMEFRALETANDIGGGR